MMRGECGNAYESRARAWAEASGTYGGKARGKWQKYRRDGVRDLSASKIENQSNIQGMHGGVWVETG
jgi:hypothetical protein